MRTKLIAAILLLAGAIAGANAQEKNAEEWQKMHVERVTKQAEKLAGDINLDADKKTEFVAMYLQYQNDLMAPYRKAFGERPSRPNGEQAEPTAEEAKAQVDKFIERQEKMAEAAKAQVAVHKKYRAAFEKILTPQQLAKVLNQASFNPMGGQNRQNRPQGQGRQGRQGRRNHNN